MINYFINKLRKMIQHKCRCDIKDWTNDRFDFTDHTLVTYRGFKTQYKDEDIAVKTGNFIQEFLLCKYCRHFRCKQHFGMDKYKKNTIRKCCHDCLQQEQIKRDARRLKYSILEKKYIDENGSAVNIDDLEDFCDKK